MSGSRRGIHAAKRRIAGLIVLGLIAALFRVPFVRADGSESAGYNMVVPVPVLFVHGYSDKGASWEKSQFYQYVQTNGVRVKSVDYERYNRNDVTSDTLQNILAESIQELLQGLPKSTKFDIVVHSMGGLFVREYLNRNPELYDRVRRVMFVGTPNHGAPVALLNRIASMIDEPEEYWAGGDTNPDVLLYKDIYRKFCDNLFGYFDGPLYNGYEGWLVQNFPHVIQHIIDRQREKASPVNISTPPLYSKVNYRYSGALEEYAKLLTGRNRVLGSFIANVIRDAPSKEEALIGGGLVDEVTGIKEFLFTLGKGEEQPHSAKNIVQDRLMYEWFLLGSSIDQDGKLQRQKVISNLWLHNLWLDESQKRYQRVEEKSYVPQYITIATVGKISSWAVDVFIKNKSAYENEQHDSVVPLSSVTLTHAKMEKERGLDRNVQIIPKAENLSLSPFVQMKKGDYVFHSFQMGETKMLRSEYDHPLTGVNDRDTLLRLEGNKPASRTGRIVVVYPADRTEPKSFLLNLKSNNPGTVSIMKRDKWQTWKKSESITLQPGDYSGYQAELEIKPNDDIYDYLIVAPDEIVVSSGVEKHQDIPENPYYIELLHEKQSGNRVTQTFRVIRRSSDAEVGDFSKDDFVVRLDGKTVNHMLTVSQTNLETTSSFVLSLDYSGSMDGRPKRISKYAAEQFISSLDRKTKARLGVIGFTDQVQVLSPLTEDYASAKKSVHADITGGTALYDSIIAGTNLLSQESGNKKLMIMTDGDDTQNLTTLEQAVQAANRAGVSLYPLGLGAANKTILNKLAKTTNGKAYYTAVVGNFKELYNNLSGIQSYIYKVDFEIPEDGAAHQLSIGLTGNRSINSEKEIVPTKGMKEKAIEQAVSIWEKGKTLVGGLKEAWR